MSHFTKCELKVKNLEAIKRALVDMQLSFSEAESGQAATVRGYRGQTLDAKLSVDMGKYDIGVVEAADGSYEFVADWWGVETTKGLTEADFQIGLRQKYAYHNVKLACEEQGYSFEEENVEEDGTVKLTVRKWVND